MSIENAEDLFENGQYHDVIEHLAKPIEVSSMPVLTNQKARFNQSSAQINFNGEI